MIELRYKIPYERGIKIIAPGRASLPNRISSTLYQQLLIKNVCGNMHAFLATLFFISASVTQCCSFFLWIELQMLHSRCLIHISIMSMRQLFYLLYLCLSMSRRGPFMSYFCDLCFIFIFVFIMINRVILWINTSLFFLLAFFGVCRIIFRWYRGWRIWRAQSYFPKQQ